MGLGSDSGVRCQATEEQTWMRSPELSEGVTGLCPTSVFLPGENGHRFLVGYSPGGHKKSDMTE